MLTSTNDLNTIIDSIFMVEVTSSLSIVGEKATLQNDVVRAMLEQSRFCLKRYERKLEVRIQARNNYAEERVRTPTETVVETHADF